MAKNFNILFRWAGNMLAQQDFKWKKFGVHDCDKILYITFGRF